VFRSPRCTCSFPPAGWYPQAVALFRHGICAGRPPPRSGPSRPFEQPANVYVRVALRAGRVPVDGDPPIVAPQLPRLLDGRRPQPRSLRAVILSSGLRPSGPCERGNSSQRLGLKGLLSFKRSRVPRRAAFRLAAQPAQRRLHAFRPRRIATAAGNIRGQCGPHSSAESAFEPSVYY